MRYFQLSLVLGLITEPWFSSALSIIAGAAQYTCAPVALFDGVQLCLVNINTQQLNIKYQRGAGFDFPSCPITVSEFTGYH